MTVYCGPGVERLEHGVFEGAWSGPFEEGRIDKAETVAGSGLIVSADGVRFVPPSHPLECLYHFQKAGVTLVSNSLVFLVTMLDAPLEYRSDTGYRFASVSFGLKDYGRDLLDIAGGTIRRTVLDFLDLRDGALGVSPKPPSPRVQSYEEYRSLLLTELGALIANAAAAGRRSRYQPLSTCSSGYDSTVCLALLSSLGPARGVSLASARGGVSDNGLDVAKALGAELQLFPLPDGAGDDPVTTAEFMAGGNGGADTNFLAFESVLPHSLLITGFNGDNIWTPHYPSSHDLVRTDLSGIGLGEFRFRLNFIHLPLPFIAAREHPAIQAVGLKPDMEPFTVGSDYERQIARRLAEEQGVPRDAFGHEKKAASALLHLQPERQNREFRRRVDALRAKLPPRTRLGHRLRAAWHGLGWRSYHLVRRTNERPHLARLAWTLHHRAFGDVKTMEHSYPDSHLEIEAAIDLLAPRYRLPELSVHF